MHIHAANYDDLFEETDQQTGFDKWIEGKQSLFEERMVKLVVNKLGLGKRLSTMLYDLKEWGGKDAKLNFNWFHEHWPTFPIRLCTEQTVYTHKIDVVDLYKRFTNTMMYKAYIEAKELIPDGEQYNSWGLIFPWSGMGYAILHNSSFIPGGTRFIKQIGKQHTVFLDQFSEFLEEIEKAWRP